MTIQPTRDITTPMIIMGVDPGIARVGWSFIQPDGGRTKPIAYGCIETEKGKPPEDRLSEVYDALGELLSTHKPDCMAVEDLFFSTNAKTAIAVGQSRGVVLLSASKHHIPVISYSPLAIKLAVTGSGKADKTQVSRMVVLTLKLDKTPKLDDTTDALAIAMTHAYSYKIKQLI